MQPTRSPLALLALLLVLPMVAAADPDPRFAALQKRSEPLGGLGVFLDKYVGGCDDLLAQAECEANAKSYRKEVARKRFYMLRDDARDHLTLGEYDPDSGELLVLLTPIFGANGFALTSGTPSRLDANGNPMMKLVKLKGSTTQGFSKDQLERLFRRGEFQLELIFSPVKPWALRRGKNTVQGVQAKILGVAVVHSRTGETIAAWIDKRA